MWRIRQYEEVGSTNTLAKELLAVNDARHGDVLQAHHQTAGRGRLGNRAWFDDAGQSLLMTIVLERFPLAGAELAQYVCALAVLGALRGMARDRNVRLDFRLKWPNDILVDGKKICGVLSEAVWHSNYLKGVVLGVGLNVRQTEFPESLAIATSLVRTGLDVTIEDVRSAVLEALESELGELDALPEHLARMNVISMLRQELEWLRDIGPLTLHGANESHGGLSYQGITELAFLILTGQEGESFTTNSGSLEIPGYHSLLTHEAIIT
jgi:BirA family biotin operon repressor/biotin-[acetyl-CoA-carboxylase] ligase